MFTRLFLRPAVLLAPLMLLALPDVAASAPAFGPPLLCSPFDIGDAASLPFGKGPFDVDAKLSKSDALPLALTVFDQSDDATVHMETVRRLVITLGDNPGLFTSRSAALKPVIDALAERHDLAVAELASHPTDGATRRAVALTAIDLAYASGAAANFGVSLRDPRETSALVTTAVALAPDDGAVHLFAALLAMNEGQLSRMYRHLDSALVRAPNEDGMLCRNICESLGRNLGLANRRALVARVAERVEQV